MVKTQYFCDLCGEQIPVELYNKSQLCTMTARYGYIFHYHQSCIHTIEQVCKALGLVTTFMPPSPLSNGYLVVKGYTF